MATLGDLAARIIISADDRTGPAIRSVNAGTQSMVAGITALETAAKRILGITLFVGLAKEAINLSDAYKTLQGRLKQVTSDSQELEQVNKRLFTIAQTTQTPLQETVNLYARAALALNKMNNSQELAAKLTETVALSFKAQNSSTSEMSSTVLQLTQSLATGNVTWEDFGNVAQSNLLLANVAAKNLGFDGIASLKLAISKAQVSGVQMTEAIIKGYDEIKAAADKTGITVKGAWTQINTALLQYIGQSKEANSASGKLSSILQGIAKYFNEVAAAAITLAEIYVARLAIGMVASTKAFVDNAAAARLAAIAATEARAAAIALLQVRVQEAAAAVQSRTQLVMEASQRRALATGIAAETVAIAKLAAAQNALVAAQGRLVAANTRLAASMETAAVSSGILSKALGFLGGAMNKLLLIWLAFDISKPIAEMIIGAEKMRILGTYIDETQAKIAESFRNMMDGGTMTERLKLMETIHARYEEIRKNDTISSQKAKQAIKQDEEEKTKAVEEASLKQQQAFATTQAAVKALTATIDADTKTQTAAIQQGLSDRLAAIERMDVAETQRDTLKAQAKLTADTQERLLNKQAFDLKLQLINQEYAAELLSAQNNADRLKAVEISKREAKLSVYRGVADYYAGEMEKLSGLYNEETAKFAKSRVDMATLEKDHKNALRDLDRLYKSDYQNLRQDQNDFDGKLNLITLERKKKEGGSQKVINDLIEDAKKLAVNLSEATKKGDISQYKEKENLNKLFAAEKLAIEDNSKAHENNAIAIKKAMATAQTELTSANLKIKELTDALTKEYLMKVGLDPSALSAAQAAIADLVRPETKIITIVTQRAQSEGGPVGYAKGGYANRAGYLPGFGGGDKIKALLEAGEFIIRKEAVKTLGVPVMQMVNAGQLPAGVVIKRAFGGLVSDDEISSALAKKKREDDANIVSNLLANPVWYGAAYTKSSFLEGMTPNDSLHGMIQALGDRRDLIPYVVEGVKNLEYSENNDKKQAYQITKDLIIEKIKAGATEKTSTPVLPALPAISMPSIDLQAFATKAAATATAQKPESKLLSGSAKKTVNVNFTAPGADAVSGEFNESDMDKLFKALKSAGLRTSV